MFQRSLLQECQERSSRTMPCLSLRDGETAGSLDLTDEDSRYKVTWHRADRVLVSCSDGFYSGAVRGAYELRRSLMRTES